MKFEIKNRFSGDVIFTAEIDGESDCYSVRLGLAIRSAIKAGADLADAYMARANLAGAYMAGANLAGANLAGAYMAGANGLNDWIKCIQIDDWPITYTSDFMQIGCQRHPLDAWRNFSDAEIRAMDGIRALNFWRKWKGWIFQAIEMAPAKPTKGSEDSADA